MKWYNEHKEEYNREPVTYCKRCLSLNIKYIEGHNGECCCEECGGTDFAETSIDEHGIMYFKKYGKHLI